MTTPGDGHGPSNQQRQEILGGLVLGIGELLRDDRLGQFDTRERSVMGRLARFMAHITKAVTSIRTTKDVETIPSTSIRHWRVLSGGCPMATERGEYFCGNVHLYLL